MKHVEVSKESNSIDPSMPYFSLHRIGEYCVDRNRDITLGRSKAKYVYEEAFRKRNHFDLNEGFETWEKKEGDEKLDVLLDWIIAMSPAGGSIKKTIHEADFVSWRGVLTKIAVIPFGNDPLNIVACKRQGVIFLCEQETDKAIARKASETARDKQMTYWGFKFEHYVSIEAPNTQPNTSEPVCCLEEFATVLRTTLQPRNKRPLKLFYSGEVDCIDEAGRLIELKTQKGECRGGFWRHKSLKWGLQSYLAGIWRIGVGHRDDNGIVSTVDNMDVNYLMKNCEFPSGAALTFLANVLEAVQNMLEEDEACSIEYNVTTDRQRTVTVRQIPLEQADFLSNRFKQHFAFE